MSVRDGRIVLPDGMSYRLLVLPENRTMSPALLQRIAELVDAGATVVGPKPLRAPGLTNYPKCDAVVKELADKVWGDCDAAAVKEHRLGKGRIIWGKTLQEILAADGIKPDFAFTAARTDANLEYIHRRVDGTEIYFVANRNNRFEDAVCTFRVSGKAPELWMPDTGEVRPEVVYEEKDGRLTLPLRLTPRGSVFVVFRKPGKTAGGKSAVVDVKELPAPQVITGRWKLTFPPGRGAPAEATFEKLTPWNEHSNDGIKYFSGTATYHKTFDLRQDLHGKTLLLDLGKLKNLAEVKLNGKELGVLWKPPFHADITGAVKPGNNKLEIRITNLWPNRLIGDSKLPREKRLTKTNVKKFDKGRHKPLHSGLFGPVRILAIETAKTKL